MIELLERLVAIDSVNPSLVPGGAGEGEAAAVVAEWAADAGLQVELIELIELTAGRPSVIVRTGRSGHGPTLLLCGHLDTVDVGGMSDPLIPRVDGDRLYARGGYEMKAGLAAALVACRDAAKTRISGEVIVDVEADMAVLIASCRAADPGLDASARTVVARDPFENRTGRPADRRRHRVGRRRARATGRRGRRQLLGGLAFISAAGIPTVLFGPSGDPHADTEWVSLPSTIAYARVLTAAGIRYCR